MEGNSWASCASANTPRAQLPEKHRRLPIKMRAIPGGLLPIFSFLIQIFLRHVVFGDFVRMHFPFLGIRSTLYTL